MSVTLNDTQFTVTVTENNNVTVTQTNQNVSIQDVGAQGPATTDASLLTTGTLNSDRLPATGIFTTAVQAKETGETYPAAQIASTGKIWSQPSKFPPYTGRHNDQYVGYGTDTQVYIERNDLTSDLVTLRMNRFQAITREQAQVTSGSFPITSGTMTLADISGFPDTAGSGTLFYDQYSNALTTPGTLPAGWTNRTPFASPAQGFTVTSTGAYCSTNNAPSIATVETGETNHEVTCRFSGTLFGGMGIVVRYNDLGSSSASWISVRYNSSTQRIDIYGIFQPSVGTSTQTFIGQTDFFVSGMYVKAIVEDDAIAVYLGTVDDQGEIQYSTPFTSKLSDARWNTGRNAGLVQHGSTTSGSERFTTFSVRAKKSFTYTGTTATTAPAGTLDGVTCATSKTFTADSTTFATYTDISPINIVRAVDSIGAVIWRLKNVGGQHTTDNITMGANDDGDIGLAFQSDANRTGSGLVFFGDSAPTGTSNPSGSRGTFLRRVAARLIRSGGRIHIAPSDISNSSGVPTGNGTATEPHLGIGNVDTGLYLTTASSVDTLRVAVDGANVASFSSAGFDGALASTVTATTQTAGDNSTKVATTAFVTTADQLLGTYTAYTPTWNGGVTIGNGTFSSAYATVNKLTHYYGTFTFGSTSAITAATVTISLPTTPHSSITGLGFPGFNSSQVNFYDTSAFLSIYGVAAINSATGARFYVNTANGTYLAIAALSSTIPFTWATGDIIQWNMTYRTA